MAPKQLGIIDLLEVYGFDRRLKTKLVRHKDVRYDLPSLIRDGWFDLYQGSQSKPIFNECQQIVSFIGEGSNRARLIGVYRVMNQSTSAIIPMECPYREWEELKYFYEMEYQDNYSDLEGRAVIDWGSGTLAWHQHLKNKSVVEVLPRGRMLEPFTDYLDFTLSYAELKELIANPGAHRDWHSSLAAVSGVYMILAQPTGHQYVGAAYGLNGIWDRWSQYAANGHGGNVLLRKLVTDDSSYPNAFRFSILQVLPKTTTKTEVIRWETQYKHKLGSRATGLNAN